MPRERGHFDGPLPQLLAATSPNDLCVLLAGSRPDSTQAIVEFGADQAVLVRNEDAKSRLPGWLAGALVLTVGEAKGLEFADVVLWDFFGDSPCGSEWRLTVDYLRITHGPGPATWPRPLGFDPRIHAACCNELKHLYVAVTRARSRLLVYDANAERRQPLFVYWQELSLADPCSVLADTDATGPGHGFGRPSTLADWQARGDSLLSSGPYLLAAQCYQRAGADSAAHRALAHHHSQLGLAEADSTARRSAMLQAASHAARANDWPMAGRCLEHAGENGIAAQVYAALGQQEEADRCRAHEQKIGSQRG